ncbi:MAG: hypothetical protein IPN38_05290, partial [Flavobacteriales bacterium]|nr:hypothetical protein [Flavobacteriales bacterium]
AHGDNTLEAHERSGFWKALWSAVTAPMFLLLVAAATLHFILGELGEAWFMLGPSRAGPLHLLLPGPAQPQDAEALAQFTKAKARAIHNNAVVGLPTEELVVDRVIVNEGNCCPPMGWCCTPTTSAVNESILTGEPFSVLQGHRGGTKSEVFRGTQAVGGLAVVRITQVGAASALGKIGTSMTAITENRSPLEQQISRFVRNMASWAPRSSSWSGGLASMLPAMYSTAC